MTIDNLDMNHINSDSENNQVPMVQENTQPKTLDGVLSDVNKWLNWLRLELPKTKEEQEKEVLELVKINWLRNSFENNRFTLWITVNKIKDWVFSVVSNKNWNINYFVNEKWDVLLWIVAVVDRHFVKNWKAFEYAWFKEKKEDWKYNMYKVEWWKELWPIDINSPEYYQAWQDIIFYADILNKLASVKFNNSETEKWVEVLIKWGSFRFEDLELFLSEWLITREIFDYWIKEMQRVIVVQCGDERLINMKFEKNDFRRKDWTMPEWIDKLSIWWIKESDLRRYYVKWYIDLDIAKECYKVLPEEMKDLTGKRKK